MTVCRPVRTIFNRSALLCLISLFFACSPSSGESPGSGGSTTISTQGGAPNLSGGTLSTGGSIGSGGIIDTGGTTASGGSIATGGSLATGGAIATGGETSAGGSTTTGGKSGLGGATATGGRAGSGGIIATGGTTASGGATATGGAPATGGTTSNDGGAGGEYGFTYAVPGTHKVSCQSAAGGTLTKDVPDADWLCTFHVGGKLAYVYSQAEATGAQCLMSAIPLFTARAQISLGGVVSSLANVHYDAGGNHGNDYLQFDNQGKTYRYFHSSFGFGWRACAPMDCINVYTQGSTTFETEGCTPARTLPEVCVPIKADATHAPLVDTFKKCPGDTNK